MPRFESPMSFQWAFKILLIQLVLALGLLSAHADDTSPSSAPASQECTLPGKRMERLELIFGLDHVTARAWAAFMDREVTPRFPDGLSIFDGRGQWRNRHGTINKERSRLLLIWYVRDSASEAKIEAIRSAYKRRFRQELVLRADEISCVSF